MPNQQLLRIDPFRRHLDRNETIILDLPQILPGAMWRCRANGPGLLDHQELRTALQAGLARYLGEGCTDLHNSEGHFTYICATRSFSEGMITRRENYDPPHRHPYSPHDASKARKRAAESLDRMLDDVQRETLKNEGFFYVTGSEGNLYRLSTDRYSGNVCWVGEKTGKVKGRYCAHPSTTAHDLDGRTGLLPVRDSVIAQKLMLETDEARFINIANLFEGKFPPNVRRPEEGRFCDCAW